MKVRENGVKVIPNRVVSIYARKEVYFQTSVRVVGRNVVLFLGVKIVGNKGLYQGERLNEIYSQFLYL